MSFALRIPSASLNTQGILSHAFLYVIHSDYIELVLLKLKMFSKVFVTLK